LSAPAPTATEWQAIHTVIFPEDGDPMTMPLYIDARETVVNLDAEHVNARETRETTPAKMPELTPSSGSSTGVRPNVSDVRRYSTTIAAHTRLSFATYFNAFPAAYWQEWTPAKSVRLHVELDGIATVDVFRSTVHGSLNRVATRQGATGVVEFDLPLTSFGDGGWLWFDLEAGDRNVALVGAEWQVPSGIARKHGKATVSITTYNRPDDCVAQINRFISSPELMDRIEQLLIVDQGSKRVVEAEGFEEARARMGDKLRIIEQPNLGGSGGFSRGMYEAVRTGGSDYVLLLDDDVVVEPEGILRAINFGDFTRRPTIVGGHMLNLYERSVLHSYGERVNLYRSMWESVDAKLDGFNFAAKGLRSTLSLHRRADVSFNGWWMCLIPREVVEEIGLSLPVFIKWDDCEYGLRASAHGFPTVSLPGAAVWHMPWTEKNDQLDWQAYYHQRNRWVVGLLYSPYRRGGGLSRESFFTDIKHLLSLQYSAVAMRNQALHDLISGPEHLHSTIGERAAEMRALRASFSDGAVLRDVASYPPVKLRRPPSRGKEPHAPRGRVRSLVRAARGALRQFLRPTLQSSAPERRVAAPEARWWLLVGLESALVSTSDGSGVTQYRRDREHFLALLRESARLHWRLRRKWTALAHQYSAALPALVSPQAWERTFGIDEGSRTAMEKARR